MTSLEALTRAAVIGHPVQHSLSPAMFNTMFARDGLHWHYGAVDVTEMSLSAFIDSARRGEFGAFSVTMPLKSAVVDHLDSLDTSSQILRAVNSVLVTPAGLVGFNTDGDGCCDALERVGSTELHGASSVVIGAGGTARSVALSLASRGARVAILNRSISRADDVVRMISEARPGYSIRTGSVDDLREASIVVNATPVGMGHDVESSPIAAGTVAPGAVVLDAVYQPLETAFLRDARSTGARVVDGLWMLVHQAMRQYTLWFGVEADAAAMRLAAEQELSRRHK